MRLGASAAARGSMEQQKRLDVIANNIANSNSPGFKKDSIYFSQLIGALTYSSFEQGPIRETGNKMDVALTGDGFLRVKTDSGTLYTRAGNLTLDKSKNLVTQDGYPVLAGSGPITINNPTDLRIEENGQVFDGKTLLGSIDIVQFPQNAELKKTQGGYFEAPQGTTPAKAEKTTLRQGALEGPNFNPVEQMIQMVETTRNFEAFQKMMQTFDRDLDSQLISKLAG